MEVKLHRTPPRCDRTKSAHKRTQTHAQDRNNKFVRTSLPRSVFSQSRSVEEKGANTGDRSALAVEINAVILPTAKWRRMKGVRARGRERVYGRERERKRERERGCSCAPLSSRDGKCVVSSAPCLFGSDRRQDSQ